jgi:hypothetical protein
MGKPNPIKELSFGRYCLHFGRTGAFKLSVKMERNIVLGLMLRLEDKELIYERINSSLKDVVHHTI